MFCPKCETEYRPEIERCADCGTSLVPELVSRDHPEPALLFSSLSRYHVWHVRSLLEGCGIDCWVGGSTRPTYTGEPCLVYVRANDLVKAQEILASLPEPSEVTPATAPAGRGDELSQAESDT
jgi:hypothetical protein